MSNYDNRLNNLPELVKTAPTIKDLRQRKGYTQQHLADMLGTCQARVSEWERGVHYPNYVMYLRILKTCQ